MRKLKILFAEDEAINRIAISLYLKETGYDVTEVLNGREVLNALEREHFDVILMDINMPEINGIEATRMIREREKEGDSHVYIIALTAYALKSDFEQFLAAGVDNYLSKPIDFKSLVLSLEKFAEKLDKKK